MPVEPHRAAGPTWGSSQRAHRATHPTWEPSSPCPSSHVALRVPRGTRAHRARRVTSHCASHVGAELTVPVESHRATRPTWDSSQRAHRATHPTWGRAHRARRATSRYESHVAAELTVPVEPHRAACPTWEPSRRARRATRPTWGAESPRPSSDASHVGEPSRRARPAASRCASHVGAESPRPSSDASHVGSRVDTFVEPHRASRPTWEPSRRAR